jgi:hypothetical protein
VIEAGLVAEADVGQTHAAGWAVIFGTAEGVWRDGREGRAAVEAIFDFRFWIFDWGNVADGV